MSWSSERYENNLNVLYQLIASTDPNNIFQA